MDKSSLPIGVFDSGVGGISVLRELVALMPNESFIYFGDSANAPYGTKTHGEISQLTLTNAERLVSKGIKALVIACNTATSVCIEELRKKYTDIPVVGIEPALKPAVENKENSTVLVMATPLTLSEKKFAKLLESYKNNAEIIKLPCPGLMELVEQGITSGETLENFLSDCFENAGIKSVDSVVLGCTHYPFVKDTIRKILPEAELFDGGAGTARQVKRCLEGRGLLNKNNEKGSVLFLNSLDDKRIIELSKELLNKKIDENYCKTL